MGEMAEDFEALKEYKLEVRNSKEPTRTEYAKQQIESLGYSTNWDAGNKCLTFNLNGKLIKVYPYTGWFTGKGTGDGRGIHNLIKKLKEIR